MTDSQMDFEYRRTNEWGTSEMVVKRHVDGDSYLGDILDAIKEFLIAAGFSVDKLVARTDAGDEHTSSDCD